MTDIPQKFVTIHALNILTNYLLLINVNDKYVNFDQLNEMWMCVAPDRLVRASSASFKYKIRLS